MVSYSPACLFLLLSPLFLVSDASKIIAAKTDGKQLFLCFSSGSLTVLGLTFKSLIHPELIITYSFCKSAISFSACECLISLLFIQETILTLLHILESLIKD